MEHLGRNASNYFKYDSENSLSKRPWEGREVNNCYHPATGKVRWVAGVTLIAVSY